ncbi:MAG: DUF5020 family protein [Bacteroidales bacterium]|nr:DUF5020 family protein [Bacteroidales bacterium]
MQKAKIIAVAVAALALAQGAKAQTNLQVFYDFGSDRQHVTTTLEGFYTDNWGNTFFFVDHDFNAKDDNAKVEAPSGTYMEIARCLNFWQGSKALAPFSLQVEYNGGVYNGFTIKNAFLAGVDWFLHSKDFNNTLNLKVLYKYIHGTNSQVPLQFTGVWGMQDLFGLKGLRFSGFADFWWEDHVLYYDEKGAAMSPEISHVVFISEPQLWYNVGQHIGVNNLNIGGEVELSFDFGTVRGFQVRPCAGLKWVF